MSSEQKVIKSLEKELASLPGWRVSLQAEGGKHTKVYPPDNGPIIMIPCSPGDRARWKKNLRAQLRRAGWSGTILD